MAKYSLSVLLLKQEVRTPDEALKNPVLPTLAAAPGILYWKSVVGTPPRWLGLFRPVAGDALTAVLSSSPSAVLFVEAVGRLFALTFGFGRSLLRPDAFEENFGLLVVLNCVDPTKLRSVDVNTLEAVPLVRRNQSGRAAAVADFGLDVERDVLSAASGEPDDRTLGKQVTGKDSLRLTVEVTLATIPDLLARLLDLSRQERYIERGFAWVDNLKEIRDPARQAALDGMLIDRLRAMAATEEFSRTWLAVPDPVEWSDFEGFRYQKPRRGELYDDISWQTYLEFLGSEGEALSLEVLRRHSVHFISASTGVAVQDWRVYKTVYAEVEDGRATFVLNNGKWYSAAPDFLSELDADLAAIPRGRLPLPDYGDSDEAEYNARVAADRPGYFVLMDKRLVSYGGGRSREEFCDLYSLDRHLAHVKKYAGSSVLSHLFSQGTVSAELLLASPPFRAAVNGLLPGTHQLAPPRNGVVPRDFEVVYGIVTKSKKAEPELPLFSRITLRNARDRFRALGIPMSLTWIRVGAPEVVK